MKQKFLIILILFLSLKSFAQKSKEEKNFKLENKTLIAEISQENKVVFWADKTILLNTINKMLNSKDKNFDEINIRFGNHPQENFRYYYLELKSKNSNRTFVKWLKNTNNQLYYEDTEEDKYSNLNFFVICEGNEKCFPRLFFDGSKYFWICRDTPVCVTKEEAIKNPCSQTTGIF